MRCRTRTMKSTTTLSTHEMSRDPTRVVRRSLVLAAIVCRGDLDNGASQPEAVALYDRLLKWLTQFDLWREAEPSEEKILRTPLGKLEKEQAIRAVWHAEGLAVLVWALKQSEFPRHDQKVDPYSAADAVWFLREDVEELIRSAGLRKPMQLKASREILYAIHARLRDFICYRERKDFTGWIERRWVDTLQLDAAHLIVDDDIAIDGQPINKVEYDRVQECASIANERHKAIIWLVERYPSYSQTPVDT